ncbi:MAG: WD40/YVTN/BNR-like repeat-containing protein [Alphaproteobacteria bacterium]
MTDNITYLSPNGQNTSFGTGTVTRMFVGTVDGVVTLDRRLRGKPWAETARGLKGLHVGALLHEEGSERFFAGCHADGGLWVSEDGSNWRRLTEGLAHDHFYSLAAREHNGVVTLFAGASPAALYRSDDLGETWSEISALRAVPGADAWTFIPPPHHPHLKNLVFHPTEPETFFVLVEQGALLKTTDDGATWTELNAYASAEDTLWHEVHRLMIHPYDPDLMYLATGEGLFRTRDGGESFVNVHHRGERMGYPEFLFLDPSDHKTIWMGGSHLNPTEWFRDGIADSTILQSRDQGDSWTEPNAGFPNPVIGAFEAMSMHLWYGGMMIVIGTATGEIWATDDYCRSWVCLDDDVPSLSKEDHHLPFMSDADRAAAMAARGL